jgi:serralysin
LGAAAFGATPGELRVSGGLIQGDVNGDGVADIQIGYTGLTPGVNDFTP